MPLPLNAFIGLALLFICAGQVSAQYEFVVLTHGDTLFGNVRGFDDIVSCQKVVIDQNNGGTLRFRPREIIEYYRTDYGPERYVTHEVWKKASMWPNLAFLRVHIDGFNQLLIYDYAISGGGPMAGGFVAIQDQYLFTNNNLKLIKEKEFNKTFGPLLENNDGVKSLVDGRYLNYYDMEAIISLLNAPLGNDQQILGFEHGNVTLISGSTVQGLIKRVSDEMSCYEVVMLDHTGEARILDRSELIGYKRGNEVFKRCKVKWGNKHVGDSLAILKLLLDGPIKVFKHTLPNSLGRDAFTDYRSQELLPYSNNIEYYLDRSGDLTRIGRDNFKKVGPAYFAEHTVIVNQIEKRKLKFSDLKEIVKEYNNFLNFMTK